MNWHRGLLRLWVVFSLVWLLACGAWGLSQWHAGIGSRFPVTDPSGLKFIVTAPVGTPKTEILPFLRRSDVVKRWQADCNRERSASCRREIPVHMPGVMEDFVRSLVFAISTPFVVLVLGLVGSWVIFGFRRPAGPKP
jgi:hypothetical protein